eukprot:CAMPEP_0194389598 /NCGR_PEP_ID=MMETSP0174-20130528/104971_1 /TAXON_ID=216777 /ORGANISM="Proboscia alata, Strain PI-D3" /LENGTH=60 /DNA_ID=CAMNT_0039182013 /DNA_START=215 /DNA_END=397 /DNA_ORIENTATION=-
MSNVLNVRFDVNARINADAPEIVPFSTSVSPSIPKFLFIFSNANLFLPILKTVRVVLQFE